MVKKARRMRYTTVALAQTRHANSSDRMQSAAELREHARRARRFESWLVPLDPSRPKLIAYANELDARAAAFDAGGKQPNKAD